VTASGSCSSGATLDRAFRAFDVETGKELWKAPARRARARRR
jgi:glucose dehydrogenase